MPKRNRSESTPDIKGLLKVCGFPQIQYLSDDQEFNMLVHFLTNRNRDSIPVSTIREHIINFPHFKKCDLTKIDGTRLICLVILWMLNLPWVDNQTELLDKIHLVQECHFLLHQEYNEQLISMEETTMMGSFMKEALSSLSEKLQTAVKYTLPVELVKAKKKYYALYAEKTTLKEKNKQKEKLHPMITKYKETSRDDYLKHMMEISQKKDINGLIKMFDEIANEEKTMSEIDNENKSKELNEIMLDLLKTDNKKKKARNV